MQVAHPVRVRAFACACGYEAKTDPLDAQVLSRYGVVFSESDTEQLEADPDCEELRQLLDRRRQLVEDRVRERNLLDKGASASVGKSTRRHLRWLDKEIERLDKEHKELLMNSSSLTETVEQYQTVPGVGQLTAATLVAYLPELGRSDSKALTSLVGLDPGRETVEESAGIGQYVAVVAWCGRHCTCAHGQRFESLVICAVSICAFERGANRARSLWLPL